MTPRPSPLSPPRGRQSGASLLEILVTLVILALGLLGIAGMKLTGIKDSHLAYQYSLAAVQAQDMAERIGANRIAAISTTNGYYKTLDWWPTAAPARGTNCLSTACSVTQLAADDFWLWNDTNRKGLPSGNGKVVGRYVNPATMAESACTTQVCSAYLIAVRWSDPTQNGALGWDSATSSDAYIACGDPNPATTPANRNLRCYVLRYRP